MASKFGNKHVFHSNVTDSRCAKGKHDLHFDSELEYATWLALRALIPAPCIKIHHPIHLIGSITWACDFVIVPTGKYPNMPILLFEAKGVVDDIFKIKAELLKCLIPGAFDRLHLVTELRNARPVAPEITLKQLRDNLPGLLRQPYNPDSIALSGRLLAKGGAQ
jgi:hypothetical protein